MYNDHAGSSLQLDCRNNINGLEQDGGSGSEQSGGSALLPVIIGLVAGLLLLLALILVALKRYLTVLKMAHPYSSSSF